MPGTKPKYVFTADAYLYQVKCDMCNTLTYYYVRPTGTHNHLADQTPLCRAHLSALLDLLESLNLHIKYRAE